MKRYSRILATALLSTSCLAIASAPSFALDLPTAYKWDMGPLGTWKLSGGVEAALSGWNNAVPASVATGSAVPGSGGGITGDVDLTNAIFILSNDSFAGLPLSFNAWIGEPPQTPVMGYTSPNVAPNLYSSNGNHGLNNTGAASFLFKGWATLAPFTCQPSGSACWVSLQAGRLPSVDGTEIGVGFLNNLPFLSDLNNMQTTVADGAQINFIAGPNQAFYAGFIPGYGSTLTIRLADGYKTGHANELGFTGLWNLTPDGSDFIVGYGHTRLSVVGNGDVVAGGPGVGLEHTNPFAVGGFGLWNSDLIGLGTVFNLTNRLSVNAEVETQRLPTSAIPAVARCTTATCGKNTSQDYYRYSKQVTLAYDFGIRQIGGEPIRFQWALQPSYTYQHGNTGDPNCNVFGNYLGLDAIPGAANDAIDQAGNTALYGTFGCGSKMYAFQTGPTFQYHNAFIRPTVAYTRLASVDPGFAYGNHGLTHDQFVVMLDFGFLLGQFEKTDTGQE